MKTSIKMYVAAIALLSVISCSKESISAKNAVMKDADASSALAFTIGQEYQGGIIIWLDETAEHGIIAAKEDASLGSTWYNGVPGITGASGKTIGTGPTNTRKIIRVQEDGSYAATICAQYKVDTYKDWYLPSKNELNEVYNQKDLIDAGDFIYWSSSEEDANAAWAQNFETGSRKKSRKDVSYRVRPVRTF